MSVKFEYRQWSETGWVKISDDGLRFDIKAACVNIGELKRNFRIPRKDKKRLKKSGSYELLKYYQSAIVYK